MNENYSVIEAVDTIATFLDENEDENYDGGGPWEYTRYGLEQVVKGIDRGKADILNTMRNHHKYADRFHSIVLAPINLGETIHQPAITEFATWLSRYLDGRVNYMVRCTAVDVARRGIHLIDDTDVDNYERRLNSLKDTFGESNESYQKFKKLAPVVGMKRARYLNKLIVGIGADKYDPYEEKVIARGEHHQVLRDENMNLIYEKNEDGSIKTRTKYPWKDKFTKYGDDITPHTHTLTPVISVYAPDYVTISNGEGWSSCLSPTREYANGCSCSGGISHGVDSVTILCYTIKDYVEGENPALYKKVNRMNVYMHPDQKHFVSAPVYPSDREEIARQFRLFFEEAWSECLGIEHHNDTWVRCERLASKMAELGEGASMYSDLWYGNREASLVYLKEKGKPEDVRCNKIYVGAEPICVECGCTHNMRNQINCCNPHGYIERVEERKCYNCGCVLHEDNEEHYSEFYDAYGCDECMGYFEGDYYFIDYRHDWICIDGFGDVPADYLEDADDDRFFKCAECGEWFYYEKTNYFFNEYDEPVCEGCHLSNCEAV